MTSIIGTVVILAILAWFIYTIAAPRTLANGATVVGLLDASRFDILSDPQLWQAVGRGLVQTLKMAAVGGALALVIGVLFSFGRTARSAAVRVPTAVVLEFLRGMPVLLMMLFILLVFATGSYWAGVVALAVYNGALIGEILRAGIQSLPRGQREAGLAIGLTPVHTRMIIEFPQAFRQMLPILVAQLVVLLKDTSLAYIVGYPELLRTVTNLGNFYGSRYTFTLFFIAFVIYLTMNLLLSWFARRLARRSGGRAAALARMPGAGMGTGAPGGGA
ncbi:amino acid ABC transporter permease [Microbacterium sp. STN6]|uniref:amino acid ABC transporter permease n=1 Tax=Microbacterium sp. STN6 TaxID=2995588 RepID=UPI002B209B8E|nr:amino acid ABC transporter permease [Microbacterium sp. STN6]